MRKTKTGKISLIKRLKAENNLLSSKQYLEKKNLAARLRSKQNKEMQTKLASANKLFSFAENISIKDRQKIATNLVLVQEKLNSIFKDKISNLQTLNSNNFRILVIRINNSKNASERKYYSGILREYITEIIRSDSVNKLKTANPKMSEKQLKNLVIIKNYNLVVQLGQNLKKINPLS
jgi:transcriptional regulator with GAF, ATPase, and Fis domain